jgi:hypothetical protein
MAKHLNLVSGLRMNGTIAPSAIFFRSVYRYNVTFTSDYTFCFQMSPLKIFVYELFIKQKIMLNRVFEVV